MKTKKERRHNIKKEPYEAKRVNKGRTYEHKDDFDAWDEWGDNDTSDLCSHYSRRTN